jgi:hypothetical protein
MRFIVSSPPVHLPNGLVLHRIPSSIEVGLIIAAVILFIPTFSFVAWPIILYFILREIFRKTYLVKNEKTGEKLIVHRAEYRAYHQEFKQRLKKKNKTVHSISDLEAAERTKELEAKADYLSKINQSTKQ